MRKIEMSASVNYVDGNRYSMEELGLNENATEEEIEDAIHGIVMENLDWGWTEIEE